MDDTALFDLIFAEQGLSLDAIAHTLEAQLPSGQLMPQSLESLRFELREGDEHEVLRGMLVVARAAPESVAAATAIYGMWLARTLPPGVSLDLLRVAAWAYRWANDELGRARALTNLAAALYIRDQFDEAHQCASEAAEIFAAVDEPIGVVKCKLVIADVAYERQHPSVAEAICHELLGQLQPLADDASRDKYTDVLILLGLVAEDLRDDFSAAERFYDQAEGALATLAQPAAHGFRLWLNQGYLAMRLGRHAEARRAFDEAGRYLKLGRGGRSLTDDDAYDLGLAQAQHALLLADCGLARAKLDELQELKGRQAFSPKQQAELDALLATLSDQFEQALPLYHSALGGFRQLGLGLIELIWTVELAERAFQAGQLALGRATLGIARGMLTGRHTPRRALAIERVAAQYDLDLSVADCELVARRLDADEEHLGATAVWDALGQRYEQAGDTSAAQVAYGRAIAAADRMRGLARLSFQSLPLLAARRHSFDRAQALSHDDPTLAWTLGEQARSQALLDEISNAGIWRLLSRDDTGEIQAAYRRLAYEWSRASLRAPRAYEATVRDEPGIPSELQAAEAAYFASLERVQMAGQQQVGWIMGKAQPLDQVQAALPPSSLLAAYTLAEGPKGPELWLTTLSESGMPSNSRIASAAGWRGFLKQWPIEGLLDSGVSNPAAAAVALREIYAAFVEPLAKQLADIRLLIVALDERMPLLPIHAALDDCYLLERVAVSYIPSGTALAMLSERARGRQGGEQIVLAGWDAAGSGLEPLADVPPGLDEVALVLGAAAQHGPHDPGMLLGSLTRARIAHLSCHGAFPTGRSPRFAHLVLGPQPLYADDLYRADLSADLLFLNACDSGQHGVGLQGFVSAALVSGASAVIAAMWKLRPSIGRHLPRRFYEHWRAGCSCAEALRQAQIELRDQPPVLWAPYYLTGLPEIQCSVRAEFHDK